MIETKDWLALPHESPSKELNDTCKNFGNIGTTKGCPACTLYNSCKKIALTRAKIK